jgi:hypothetical protein
MFSDKMERKIKKAPVLNILFGIGATAEAIVEAFMGDLEAAGHSLIAAGYNYASGLIPYAPALEKIDRAREDYVNGGGALINGLIGTLDNIGKAFPSARNSRSISYSTIQAQTALGLMANAVEAYDGLKLKHEGKHW